MGYFDAFAVNVFRTDSRGQKVLLPFGSRGRAYLVPPERVGILTRFVRWYYGVMMVLFLGGVFLLGPLLTLTTVAPAYLALYYVRIWWFTRGLELAPEVPVLSRSEVAERTATAMGVRTIASVSILAGLMALLGAWLLTTSRRSVPLWLLTLYFGAVAILYARRWRQVKNRTAAA